MLALCLPVLWHRSQPKLDPSWSNDCSARIQPCLGLYKSQLTLAKMHNHLQMLADPRERGHLCVLNTCEVCVAAAATAAIVAAATAAVHCSQQVGQST
jgi:hypothetical protein